MVTISSISDERPPSFENAYEHLLRPYEAYIIFSIYGSSNPHSTTLHANDTRAATEWGQGVVLPSGGLCQLRCWPGPPQTPDDTRPRFLGCRILRCSNGETNIHHQLFCLIHPQNTSNVVKKSVISYDHQKKTFRFTERFLSMVNCANVPLKIQKVCTSAQVPPVKQQITSKTAPIDSTMTALHSTLVDMMSAVSSRRTTLSTKRETSLTRTKDANVKEDEHDIEELVGITTVLLDLSSYYGLLALSSVKEINDMLPDAMHDVLQWKLIIACSVRMACAPQQTHIESLVKEADIVAIGQARRMFEENWSAFRNSANMPFFAIDALTLAGNEIAVAKMGPFDRIQPLETAQIKTNIVRCARAGLIIVRKLFGTIRRTPAEWSGASDPLSNAFDVELVDAFRNAGHGNNKTDTDVLRGWNIVQNVFLDTFTRPDTVRETL